ncbi:MAG: 3-phenylpropionate/trans-cinnamate dioxygenase ferredoxin reductase component [Propionibacteriaceae bacterium]|jgi:NADPH-dependent 2,4-dienoyl-CoA reductase/sulfur reductase-like enzyme|nr:3-phenylpropionate/trans-cinnamate dioxygenase ferredoxin reductase component [Propionibacteriaceae bacterium]
MSVAVRKIIIVGASLGGASAALALREQGYDGELLVIGTEAQLPYERPPLSKAVMLGERDEPDWVAERKTYSDQDIAVMPGTTVTRIRPGDRMVEAAGVDHPYDALLLATGASPRRLAVPGADLPGVFTLRTLDDALAIRSRFTDGARVVIVGAGWIGCEVAAAARRHNASVTMIDPAAQPLVRVVGVEVGGAFAGLHRDHGVDLRLGVGVLGFDGDNRVTAVAVAGADPVPADTVVVGVGVQTNIGLAVEAGLETADGGVAVDATLRTSDRRIYAVGDIAAHDHPAYPHRVRVEHWANAKDQGRHVAQNLLGAAVPFTARPFFFSDQYDLGCEYRGLADPERDDLVVRGDLNSREFTAFWLRNSTVAAAMNVNQWDDGDALQRLVDDAAAVSADDLRSGRF